MNPRMTLSKLLSTMAIATAIVGSTSLQGIAAAQDLADTATSTVTKATEELDSAVLTVKDTAEGVKSSAESVVDTTTATAKDVASTADSAVGGVTDTAQSTASSLTGTGTTTSGGTTGSTSSNTSSLPQSAPQATAQAAPQTSGSSRPAVAAGASTARSIQASSTLRLVLSTRAVMGRLKVAQRTNDTTKLAGSGNLIGAQKLASGTAGSNQKAGGPSRGSESGPAGLPFTGLNILVWLIYAGLLVGFGGILSRTRAASRDPLRPAAS